MLFLYILSLIIHASPAMLQCANLWNKIKKHTCYESCRLIRKILLKNKSTISYMKKSTFEKARVKDLANFFFFVFLYVYSSTTIVSLSFHDKKNVTHNMYLNWTITFVHKAIGWYIPRKKKTLKNPIKIDFNRIFNVFLHGYCVLLAIIVRR